MGPSSDHSERVRSHLRERGEEERGEESAEDEERGEVETVPEPREEIRAMERGGVAPVLTLRREV